MKKFLDNFYAVLGFSILTGCFYLLLFFMLGIYYGNIYVRLLFIIIYIYQCTLCKKSLYFNKLLSFLKPYDYFYSNGTIYEDEPPLSDSKNMIAFHPHGIMATLLPLNYFRSKNLANFHFLATRALFFIPFGGILSRWLGIEPVDPLHFESLLEKGENIAFLPGGFEEATITNHNQDQVWIKNRKGFIKYALKYGYNLYPCYSFNENRIFSCFTYFEDFRLLFNKFKTPAVFFWGKYLFLPRRDIKMFTVIGKRIPLPQLKDVTKEDVEKYHDIYLKRLEELYNKYKEKFESSPNLIIK